MKIHSMALMAKLGAPHFWIAPRTLEILSRTAPHPADQESAPHFSLKKGAVRFLHFALSF
jgi:hypothetical protein